MPNTISRDRNSINLIFENRGDSYSLDVPHKNVWLSIIRFLKKRGFKVTVNSYFKKQYKICENCGLPIPIGGMSDRATFDLISRGNLKKLKKIGSPKVINKNYATYDRTWDKEQIIKGSKSWKPYNFRTFYAHGPEDYSGDNKA